MNRFTTISKLVMVCSVLLCFLAVATISLIVPKNDLALKKMILRTRSFIKVLLRILNIEVTVSGCENIPKNGLIVANHLSYLEVLALQIASPSIFVTSKEIERTPFLGSLCKRSGCLFVNRRSIWNLPSETTEIESALSRGFNVTLFPEGTTTDGFSLLPFRSSLLQAAKKGFGSRHTGCS